ncbi:hypothetical protein [Spiroplasma endosymbiont of Aleiodes alternator]|uniref:hypothetical protein n=1 Tax=Spiroplasma endosymbiont of Aleiodes alternator TaxID=3139329 RepID=UPI003CCAECA4
MFLSQKLVDVFKRALEDLKFEYEDKETFHSKSKKGKLIISLVILTYSHQSI